jgi:hypothetical protein
VASRSLEAFAGTDRILYGSDFPCVPESIIRSTRLRLSWVLSSVSIGRLDSICNLLHQIVVVGEDKKWPEYLLRAATKLAKDVTNLTGALDSADGDPAHVQGLAVEAQLNLPREFAAFGQALENARRLP